MAAPVVPRQGVRREIARDALVEDALKILDFIFAGLLVDDFSEEVGRGKLLGIANDDQLISARYRSDRVPDGHLRCLVEHYDIETRQRRVQVLRHG